jgi:CheY-like chemotaxis protein
MTISSAAARVLVADDQSDVLEALRWLLTGEGYEAQFVTSAVPCSIACAPNRSTCC